MKITHSIALAAALALLAGSAAAFNFSDAAKMASGVSGGNGGGLVDSQTAGLVSALSGLGVTPQQAVGGTGALLGLAKNKLQGAEYAQLADSVPGVEKLTGNNALSQLGALGGLLGKSGGQSTVPAKAHELLDDVDSMQDVNQAFSALGMDSGLVGQFAPILLDYFGNQGVAGPLLQSLASVWGVGGA